MITHYDLFAGIGGFSLALDEVFKNEEIKHIFCEWVVFPTAVLRQHWPDGEYWGDIADLIADTNSQRLQREQHKPETKRRYYKSGRGGSNKELSFTIVTGGFPCQPFSHAGRRQGTADDRYKWPEMFEVIRNVKPDWVIAENVRGLTSWNEGMVLEQVCADLESEGYEVQPFIIPAVAVGAPHRRDRVWIIAHNAQNAESKRMERSSWEEPEQSEHNRPDKNYPDWSRDWREVAFATCHDRVDDGLPRELDGAAISQAKWRKESLKAYGNAIVPQVAMEIFKAIRSCYDL